MSHGDFHPTIRGGGREGGREGGEKEREGGGGRERGRERGGVGKERMIDSMHKMLS